MTNEENVATMNAGDEAEFFAFTETAPVETVVDTPVTTEAPQVTIQPVPTVSVSEVLRLLSEGYARTENDKAYNESIGSIRSYFNLTDAQVKYIFTWPSLKGKRTKQVRTIVPLVNIIDDTVVESDVNNN